MKTKESSLTKELLDSADPVYQERLVAKYSSTLTISSLGLLTDEETNKRKKHRPPIPRVALKTADWRLAYAAVSDAELEAQVAAILADSTEASTPSSNSRSKTRNATAKVTSGFSLVLPATWKSDSASSASHFSISCCMCPFICPSDADLEKHLVQHTSVNDLIKELATVDLAGDVKREKEMDSDLNKPPSSSDIGGDPRHDGCIGELAVDCATASSTLTRPISGTTDDASVTSLPLPHSSPLLPLPSPSPSKGKNVVTEVTSFKCEFCCHSAKTPLVAIRHIQGHFKTNVCPAPPTLTTVALAAADVDDILHRIPAVAGRVLRDLSSTSVTRASVVDAPEIRENLESLTTSENLENSSQVKISASMEKTKLNPLENLEEKIKIQGGSPSLDPKDLVSRSIADFRSKIHESTIHQRRDDLETLEEKIASTSSLRVLESVFKAHTNPVTSVKKLEAMDDVQERTSHDGPRGDRVTVDCSLCDVALEPSQMSKHAARHVAAGQKSLLDDADEDSLHSRLQWKLSSFREEEKREMAHLLLDLEDDATGNLDASKATSVSCRFCAVELDPGNLLTHEARHSGIS